MARERIVSDHRLRQGLMILAAVLIGLGVGSMIPPNPVSIPAVGSVSAFVVGPVAVGLGVGTYLGLRRQGAKRSCGCVGSCSCEESRPA